MKIVGLICGLPYCGTDSTYYLNIIEFKIQRIKFKSTDIIKSRHECLGTTLFY